MAVEFRNSAGVISDAVSCYDALVILQGVSGLPADRFLNTWHFAAEGGGTRESHYSAIQFELGGFYDSIKQHLSTVALGMTNLQIECRIYHAEDDDPREPHPVTLGVDMTAEFLGGVPNELAACLSFYSIRNIPRSRGRIYVGPMHNAAMEAAVAGAGDRRMADLVVSDLVTAATALTTGTNGVVWCTKSKYQFLGEGDPALGPLYQEVTDGWVDNAFDIQRRRGTLPDLRTPFTAP